MNNNISNMADLFEKKTMELPQENAYCFVAENGSQSYINYQELNDQVRKVAALVQQHTKPGDRAILLYPPGLDYNIAFWACLMAGVLAVPAYPPLGKNSIDKLAFIIRDAKPSIILSNDEIIKGIRQLSHFKVLAEHKFFKIILDKIFKEYSDFCRWNFKDFVWISTSQIDRQEDSFKPLAIKNTDIALLQYTSGSTADPKGVMVTHENLLLNIELIVVAANVSEREIVVSWLPPYHDMGLVTALLAPLYAKVLSVLMSPVTFLRNPSIWLQTITTFNAQISGGPNFAYDYCVEKIHIEDLPASLALQSWRCAYSGAEPMRAQTIKRFTDKFGPYGFNENAFVPSYGLAEATLLVSRTRSGDKPTIKSLDAESLEKNIAVESKSGNAKKIVGCGKPCQEVIIVDPDAKLQRGVNQIGEIWINGITVAKGYWNKELETQDIFNARINETSNIKNYLRTGDLGFIDEYGELFITGRIKDLIILNGKNYYPHDIESTVTETNSIVRAGCVIAFSYTLDEQELLVIVAEAKPNLKKIDYEQALPKLAAGVIEQHGVSPQYIILIKARTLPKTTSGKLRRRETKSQFLHNQLDVIFIWNGMKKIS